MRNNRCAALTRALAAALMLGVWAAGARAAEIEAATDTYVDQVKTLGPGDTLRFPPGEYARPLVLAGLHGRPGEPIVLEGPGEGRWPATFIGRSEKNTIEIIDCSYLVIRGFVFDGRDIADDAVKAPEREMPCHHITIENNRIVRHGRKQDFVAISCFVPAWDWVIRRNTIIEAGTGLYLGMSDGTRPFIRGLIEYNTIVNPIGYACQIKQQNFRRLQPGMPTEPCDTVIRYNVLIKDERVGERGPRPNLLVDGFPESGPGSMDRYHIYGNLFYGNRVESLFQGTGRLSLHDNVFVSFGPQAVAIQEHGKRPPRSIRIYHNTMLVPERAMRIGVEPNCELLVAGNLVVTDLLKAGVALNLKENTYCSSLNAWQVLADSGTALGRLDVQPRKHVPADLPEALEEAIARQEIDARIDFRGSPKTDLGYAGAICTPFETPQPIAEDAGPDRQGVWQPAPSAPSEEADEGARQGANDIGDQNSQ